MKNKFNLKQAGAIMMASALIFASALAPASTVQAKSASGTVQLVTKSKDSDGDTTTYKYNSKGLVTKKVVKNSEKGTASDMATTTTTTYKYNKKNRITKKTVVNVEKVTEYETDKTTGKTIKGTRGTVTTTDKAVTKYTYTKAGLAKKAVTTTTTTMSGSESSKYVERCFSGNEMTNGKIIAGYNHYDEYKNRAASVYYYTGALDQAKNNSTTVTTYKDNGNGTYTIVENTTSTDANWDYVKVGSDGKEYDRYFDEDDLPEGVKFTAAKVFITNNNNDITKKKSESTIQKKTVTTSTYKYDKKKRVKKITTKEVSTENSSRGAYTRSSTEYDNNGKVSTSNTTDNASFTSNNTSTKNNTTTFTYDKNGHAKKQVYTDNGVENSQSVEITGLPNEVTTETYDGKTTVTKTTGSGAANAFVETTTVANGTRTETYVENAYTETINQNGTVDTFKIGASTKTKTKSAKAEPVKRTFTYKYDKNGNQASAKYSGTSVDYPYLMNETYDTPIYEKWDEDGYLVEAQVSVTNSTKYNVKNENALKSGTKTIKKSIRMTSGRKENRATEPGYGVSRVTYTLKAKKFSGKQKTDVEAQQWAIQNGALNGFVGLSLGF